jgi:hypothetical protein
MSFPKKDRNNQPESGNIFQPAKYAKDFAAALRREYGDSRSAVKTIVDATGANERAVKNWLHGKNGPSGPYLIELCRHSSHVLDVFLSLCGQANLLKLKRSHEAGRMIRHYATQLSRLLEDHEPQ